MKDTGHQMIWELVSPLTLEEINAQRRELLRRLQQLADDRHLQLLAIRPDRNISILKFQSAADGYRRVRTLFKTSQLANIIGMLVKDVRPMTIGDRLGTKPGFSPKKQTLEQALFISNRPAVDVTVQENQVLQHLSDCVEDESPEKILERFRYLFIDAKDYSDVNIQAALSKIALAKQEENKFYNFLSRCCYCLISPWLLNPKNRLAIAQLVELFEHLPVPGFKQARGIRHLRQLVRDFVECSEQYQQLKQFAIAICPPSEGTPKIGNLIHRYPFLFKPYLLNEGGSSEQLRLLQNWREKREHYFEFRLARFLNYQLRLAQVARARQLSQGAGRILQREKNPTLLSDRELGGILSKFSNKIFDRSQHPNLAERFLEHSYQLSTYKDFKGHLYAYLIVSLDSDYAMDEFNLQLKTYLEALLDRYHSQKMNESLLLRTVKKLLSFLTVESAKQTEHALLIDAIGGLGINGILEVLFRTILLCPSLRSELDKRLAILFGNYATFPPNEGKWLIKLLEAYHVICSIHFGSADLTLLKQLRRKTRDRE
ncbi:MAG: hypothetical protein J7647_28745 [Cyanobacteria bacterium SBLK]|nr:hypothetical protein [Cyanobacteria bacterium SBLK]